jgi:flagellar hook protein FlgE
MGFQQGLSGLNAASKTLDVIGNNISNANTVGFKMAQAQFADVYANSLSGGGTNSVGIGTRLATVAQQFTQGNITSTNNPLDIAVNGGGFFRMSTNGVVSFSRNGQFQLDKNGGIVNAQGAQLTGYSADVNGVLSTGAAVPLVIDSANISPKQTAGVKALINLDSRELVPGTQKPVASPPVVFSIPFAMADPTSYNKATSVAVFDSLGNPHQLQTFYVKVDHTTVPPLPGVQRLPTAPATQEWDVFVAVDGVLKPPVVPVLPVANSIGKLGFDSSGKIVGVTPAAGITDPKAFSIRINFGAGVAQANPMDVNFSFSGSTQFGSDFSVNALSQDGFTSGKLAKFNTNKDGMILGSYTNGVTKVLGQVVLGNFVNPNGLQSLGDNQWGETAASGQVLVGAPNTGSLGVLTSSATEDSNTDLTGELVNMITAQRIYQANAQTIKTQDQVLQTLVNLR